MSKAKIIGEGVYEPKANSIGIDSETFNGGHTTVHKGHVHTKYGTVSLYSLINEEPLSIRKSSGSSMFYMVYDGKLHFRRWNRGYTPRGLVTKAKDFARDVVNKRGVVKQTSIDNIAKSIHDAVEEVRRKAIQKTQFNTTDNDINTILSTIL